MTKLNDTQLVILSKAINNGQIVPAIEVFNVSNRATFSRAINGLIKNGFLEMRPGMKGAATAADYNFVDENEQSRRLFVTGKAMAALDGEDETPAPAPAQEKPKKAPSAKKATKVAAKVVEPVEDASEGEEERTRESKVAEPYKKHYSDLRAEGGSGQGCNDLIDRWMVNTFSHFIGNRKSRPVLDMPGLQAFAIENGIEISHWMKLNNGMQRMNIAKRVRYLLANGTDIVHGGKKVFRAAKPVKKAA